MAWKNCEYAFFDKYVSNWESMLRKVKELNFVLQFNENLYNNKVENGTLNAYKVIPTYNLVSDESIIIDTECSRIFLNDMSNMKLGKDQ